MDTLKDIINNPEALSDFNGMSRQERIKVINQLDPDFKQLKLKDRFDILDHLEGVKPPSMTEKVAEKLLPGGGTAVRGIQKVNEMARGGLRGLGVGAEVAATTPGSFKERAMAALQAATPAIQPGFKAPEGQKIGASIGENLPEILGTMATGAPVAAKGAEKLGELAETLGAKSIKDSYAALGKVLEEKEIQELPSFVRSNNPQYIDTLAGYWDKTFLKREPSIAEKMAPAREFLSPGEKPPIELSKSDFNTPAVWERIREDVTRIFNNKIESPDTSTGRKLAQVKEEVTNRLIKQYPEIGKAIKDVKSAYDKEKLIDAIMKSAKVAAIAGAGAIVGAKTVGLARKIASPFQE